MDRKEEEKTQFSAARGSPTPPPALHAASADPTHRGRRRPPLPPPGAMRPCSRILAAGHLLRGSRFDPSQTTSAAAGFRRLNGANRPWCVPKPLFSTLLGGFGSNCGVLPRNGVPLGSLGSFLPNSAYPLHGARLQRDTVNCAYYRSWDFLYLGLSRAVMDASELDVCHNTYV